MGAGGCNPYPDKGLGDIGSYSWSIDELTDADEEVRENEWKFRLNFELPLTEGRYGSKLRFGGKYTVKDKKKETHCYDYIEPYEEQYDETWMNRMSRQIRSGYMPDGNYPENTPFVSKEYLGSLSLNPSQDGAFELLEEASGNYKATERISGGYVRLDQRIGRKLDAVLGLRMEHTDLKYSGYNWIVDDEQGRLQHTGEHRNDYTPLLAEPFAEVLCRQRPEVARVVHQDSVASQVFGFGSQRSL